MLARVITLIFIFTAYLGPEKFFGTMAQFHIQVLIGVLAILVSLPNAVRRAASLPPQALAMVGLTAAVFISLVANHWVGGAVNAVDSFLPQAIPFFLILFNFREKRHIQYLLLVLLAVAFFVIYSGDRDQRAGKANSPYLITQNNSKGETFYRLRGEQFISDPNDFAQMLVGLIPLTFVLWRKKKRISNILFVYLPVVVLGYGMFLTHSRGGMLALLVLLVFAGRKRLGKIPSLVIGGLAFLASTALGWTGGRDISVGSGEDRMDAWATGLQLIKSNPIFGVGYNRFTEFYYITAHNTVVVCAAELGLFGFFFWVLFVIPSVLNSWKLASDSSSKNQNVSSIESNESTVPLQTLLTIDGPEDVVMVPINAATEDQRAELVRLGEIMLLMMVSFLTASWFISRSYVMTLFIFGGLTEVVFTIAINRGVIRERMAWNRLLKTTALVAVSLVIAVYIFLRIGNLGR